jgi:hypothetical protein
MHGPINVKSPNNASKWQMGLNSAFKGLKESNELTYFRNAFTNSDSTAAMSSPGNIKPERNTDLRIMRFVESRISEISRTFLS